MLTFAKVRYQISVPCRRQATPAQLDYLAALIVELGNAKKIRWETGAGSTRSFTVYDAKTAIERYKQLKESL